MIKKLVMRLTWLKTALVLIMEYLACEYALGSRHSCFDRENWSSCNEYRKQAV